MKLFTIPITTGPHAGKELLGYNDFEATYFETELNYGKEEYVIYNLSNITEEQAMEFGYKRTKGEFANYHLTLDIVQRLPDDFELTDENMPNILPILVSHE